MAYQSNRMRDANQQFIYSDEELSLIKNTFADNDTLLYTVRKVMLQFPLTEAEEGLIKLSITPQVVAVLKKRILPEISEDFPLGQLPHLLVTLGNELKAKNVEEMGPLFDAKKIEGDYLSQQFAVLENVSNQAKPKIVLSELAIIREDAYINYVNVNAYLFLLGYIDPMLNFIKVLAGQKDETIEATKKRLERDSNK